MTRPTPLPVNVAGIPDALKVERRWGCWRHVQDEHRWPKVPCQTSGRYARPNDPTTWTTFENALAAYQAGGFDGLGFFLGDGWAGIDLDDALAHGQAFINRLPGYYETSPSGTGVKAIGRSARMGGEIKFTATNDAVTTWSSARFFAVTGHGQGDPTIDLTPLINEWFPEKRFGKQDLGPIPSYIKRDDPRAQNFEPVYAKLDDDQIVKTILASPQAEKFVKLVRGDMSDYDDDHSRADQALCTILAYWCQRDMEQIDRLFRQTKLMRGKWNTPSYRRSTLRKAVQS